VKKDRVLSEYLSELGRKGGQVSAKQLTKKQRTERARKAGLARQAKARRKGGKG
jgi:general stress protein YciG